MRNASVNLVRWMEIKPNNALIIGNECEAIASFWRGFNVNTDLISEVDELDFESGANYDVIFAYKQPFTADVISRLSRILSDDGRLFFCLDNALGLRYFAGAKPQGGAHFDTFFNSAALYGDYYKKSEIQSLAADVDFYYPYPDEYTTKYIFTDERQPKSDDFLPASTRTESDEERFFSDGEVAYELSGEGCFSTFANVFIVEVSAPDIRKNAPFVSYAKFSDERADEFAIMTRIVKRDGKPSVVKTMLNPEGEQYCRNLKAGEDKLAEALVESPFNLCRGDFSDRNIVYPFISGSSMDTLVDRSLSKRNIDEALETIERVVDSLGKIKSVDFEVTDGFEEIFLTDEIRGDFNEVFLNESHKSLCVTDLDLNLSNLIADESGEMHIIDPEWTFDFPIPVEFLIYRIIRNYIYAKNFRRDILGEDIFSKFNIRDSWIEIFDKMEQSFQTYVASIGVSAADDSDFDDAGTDVFQMFSKTTVNMQTEIAFDFGDGFDFDHTVTVDGRVIQNEGYVLDIPAGAVCIRIDPASECGILTVNTLCDENGHDNAYTVNATTLSDSVFFFASHDPAVFVKPNANQKQLKIQFEYDVVYSYKDEEKLADKMKGLLSANYVSKVKNKLKEKLF